jgi:hypothetical protein
MKHQLKEWNYNLYIKLSKKITHDCTWSLERYVHMLLFLVEDYSLYQYLFRKKGAGREVWQKMGTVTLPYFKPFLINIKPLKYQERHPHFSNEFGWSLWENFLTFLVTFSGLARMMWHYVPEEKSTTCPFLPETNLFICKTGPYTLFNCTINESRHLNKCFFLCTIPFSLKIEGLILSTPWKYSGFIASRTVHLKYVL